MEEGLRESSAESFSGPTAPFAVKRFRARADALVLALLGTVGTMQLAIAGVVLHDAVVRGVTAHYWLAALMAIIALWVLFLPSLTSYVLTERALVVRVFPLQFSIPYDRIEQIERQTKPWRFGALNAGFSLHDLVYVRFRPGLFRFSRRGVLLSPDDPEGFCDELQCRVDATVARRANERGP